MPPDRSRTSPISECPPRDCPRCPRLEAFRLHQRAAHADWHNAPVPAFGDRAARLAIVGLAPGLRGANRTGRPFTGDFAGDLLYGTLAEFGFSRGVFAARPDDGLCLIDAMIVNAVRCVPPENKPTPDEIKNCNSFLAATLNALPRLAAIVALGRVAHDATLIAFGKVRARHGFGHGAIHDLGAITLYDSYHCSRYNTNTGVLTPEMFRAVFARVRTDLDGNRHS